MEPAKMHFLSLQSLYRYHSQLEKGWLSSADEPTHTVTDWSTLLGFFLELLQVHLNQLNFLHEESCWLKSSFRNIFSL